MTRTAYDVISIELFNNKEDKMSKHTAATEDQKKIAFQLGLDPDKLAQQVALNAQRSDDDRSLYTSFSTSDLRRGVSLHESTSDTDTLVQALSDSTVSAVNAHQQGDKLSLDRAVRNIFLTCQKLLAGPLRL